MAASLADELLQMILAPSLTIPYDQIISSSPTIFGQNDTVSSSSALLVCKRWLRVATPLLYETIIIRSTGQSQALADAFRQNPAFAQHVKKIRLEGAYASLGEILTCCTNMSMLVILFRIYSDANVTGLCRALPLIDPTDVILHDEWQIDNKKIRQTFIAFCDAIPKWRSLTTFEFPYSGTRHGNSRVEGNITRKDKLVDALTKSTSIRLVSCDVPGIHTDFWRRLARIPYITLKFRYTSRNPLLLLMQQRLINCISDELRLLKSTFEFVDIAQSPPPTEGLTKQAEARLEPPSKPLPVSSIPEHIWSTIFAFAATPGYPDRPDMFYKKNDVISSALQMNATRKHISLVCKTFEQFVRPIFFAFPLFFSAPYFNLFVEKILQNHDLGTQVHMLSLHRVDKMQQAEEHLYALIPHLTCLRHFIGWDRWSVYLPTKVFTLLAEAAGPTLRTITRLEFRHGDQPLSPAILNSFKHLVKLSVPGRPRVSADRTNLQLDALSRLRELRLEGPSDLLDTLSVMSMPRLRYVALRRSSTSAVDNFLHACGSQVEEIKLGGFANFVEIFKNTPNLRNLRWCPDIDHGQLINLATALNPSAAHEKLQKFILVGILVSKSGEKEHTAVINTFFKSLDLANFSSLKEIQFASYRWPIEQRAISKDILPQKAIDVKQLYSIDVTDSSGRPWRPRVQRR